ncbi:hypothetical protein YB2330_002631 [Saitoella coloradoensis]
MGNCGSTEDPQNAEAHERSRVIEKQLRQDEKLLAREVKLLLLGAGESGKSTILKQMRLIHTAGFSAKEREDYRAVVFTNMLQSMQLALEAMEYFDIHFSLEENERYFDLLYNDRELGTGEGFPPEYYAPFKSLWVDEGVRKAWSRGNEYALHDNAFYFFDNLERIFAPKYVPTDQDILRCRVKTTGISETVFELRDLTYRMFDVGGQRSERRKWIHCFENVTGVLFLAAISGYDQCLAEDKDANQMQEALMLFDSICNSQWLIQTSIILFLNKIDLFREKISVSPINRYFPDFQGDQTDYSVASKFFQKKFVGVNRNPAKDIYSHWTNATDTNLLRNVFISVSDIILQKNLQTAVF